MKKTIFTLMAVVLGMTACIETETIKIEAIERTSYDNILGVNNTSTLENTGILLANFYNSINSLSEQNACIFRSIITNPGLSNEAKTIQIASNVAFSQIMTSSDQLSNYTAQNNIEPLLQQQENIHYINNYFTDHMPSIPNVDPCGGYKAQVKSCYGSLLTCAIGAGFTGPWATVVGSLCFLDFGLCYQATKANHPGCAGSLTGYGSIDNGGLLSGYSQSHFINPGLVNSNCQ